MDLQSICREPGTTPVPTSASWGPQRGRGIPNVCPTGIPMVPWLIPYFSRLVFHYSNHNDSWLDPNRHLLSILSSYVCFFPIPQSIMVEMSYMANQSWIHQTNKKTFKKTYPPTRPFETVINYILQKGWFFWPCQHSKVGSPTTIQWFRKSKVAHDQEKHSISTQKHPTNLHFHKVMIENPAILKTTKGCFSEKSPETKAWKHIRDLMIFIVSWVWVN